MAFKIIERIKFRFAGKSVPCVKAADIGKDGQIHSLSFLGELKDRPNSICQTWETKGWEKDPNASMVAWTDERGIKTLAHVVSEQGKTINLYTQPFKGPAWEDVIGKLAAADDIADNMDLGKSMKHVALGVIVGAFPSYLILDILFKMIRTMAS